MRNKNLDVSKNPDDNIYTNDNYDNYARLMLKTNTHYHDNNLDSNYPKSSKGQKWKRLLKKYGIIGKSIKEMGLLLFRVILTRC